MKHRTMASSLIAFMLIFGLVTACAGPQQPAAAPGTPAAGATAAEAAASPTPEEVIALAADVPPLAPEAEGITYTDVPALAYKGELTFYAQSYTPIQPTSNTPNPPHYLNRIIAEYQKLHPDIKITLIPPLAPGNDYITWVRTQAAGQQLPDIVWLQAGQVNEQLPKGMFEPLTQKLQEPNPYIAAGKPGHDKWFDAFAGFVMEFVQATDGNWYQVNGDYVGTAIFYNKDMFTKAGIDPANPPKTWTEFINAQKALKAANLGAFAFPMGPSAFIWSWWHRVGATQFYGDQLDKMNVDKNQFRLSAYDMARNYGIGTWKATDPRYQETFRILKDWSQYWVPGSLSMSMEDAFRLFVNGDAAMYWNGSWAVPQTQNNKDIKFQWGSFPLPGFDKESTKFYTGAAVPMIGGPSAAFQYSISTKQADSTMTPEKLEAAADFLKFLTAPQNAGPMVNDLGSFIPTIVGTTPLPSMSELIKAMSNTETMGLMELTIEEGQANQRYLQEFMGGQTTMEQYMAKVDELMKKTAADLAEQNKWDWNTPPAKK
ncbi:MAG: extracellular solute-binding protein [Chloroflexi bacterium]|nr:extracellular solute-binding protein [Chloroflexota bacterium]